MFGNTIVKAITFAANNPWAVAKVCMLVGAATRVGSLAPDTAIGIFHSATSAAKGALEERKAKQAAQPSAQPSAPRATV